MAQRLKGQETEVRILLDGAPLSTLNTIRSLTIEPQFDIISEGYLGETTDRKDAVGKGVSVKLQFHHDSPEILTLIQALQDKATRRRPGIRIDVVTTLKFPSGQEGRVVVPDIEFANVPMTVASRTAYVETSFTGEASEYRLLQIA